MQEEESVGFLGRFFYLHLQIWKECSGSEGRGLVLLPSGGLVRMSYGSCDAVCQDGWVGRSCVAFAGEQTLVILRFAIIMSWGKLPTNLKEVSSSVLRKVVFEEYYCPPTLPLFTWLITPLKGLFADVAEETCLWLLEPVGASLNTVQKWCDGSFLSSSPRLGSPALVTLRPPTGWTLSLCYWVLQTSDM